jgi:hypothetical protein
MVNECSPTLRLLNYFFYLNIIFYEKAYVLIMCMIFSLFVVPACNTSRATKGAVIGAGAGAAAGAILAKDNKAAAIIFGAAVGGVCRGIDRRLHG